MQSLVIRTAVAVDLGWTTAVAIAGPEYAMLAPSPVGHLAIIGVGIVVYEVGHTVVRGWRACRRSPQLQRRKKEASLPKNIGAQGL